MTTRTPELVVLDIAGTTIDDGQHVYRVLGETAKAHGANPTEADIARWHGAAKHEALKALLTEADGTPPSVEHLAAVVDDFRNRLVAAYVEHPPQPLPGVPQALAALRRAGIRVALTTGFDHDIVEHGVECGWLAGEFSGRRGGMRQRRADRSPGAVHDLSGDGAAGRDRCRAGAGRR